ncbi:hypothetical protein GCM10010913_48670 [Paenibacillus aceti]|uniref:Secreted protein n=1 Tax=Paenibacillus aceti TaxID=1820010 RepID=A0ABQ1W9Q8_9BACL|nr:hypothetical protein GCM10010913_48670 [Paenibacillus aceti]
MYKKILNILLCIILIISTLTNTVYGASGGSNNGESGTGSLGLSFIKDPNDPKYGDLHYEALDTTGIRYVSVGWIIRKD